MFSKSKSVLEIKAVPSIISADLTIRGDMMTSGEIQIDGEVVGDIRARAVTVGEHADIQGEIIAESIVVRGKVTGRLRGRSVQLTRTARMSGDIWHKTLGIEGGAVLQGQCLHMDEPDTAQSGQVQVKSIEGTSGPVLVSQSDGARRLIADAAIPDLLASGSAAAGD